MSKTQLENGLYPNERRLTMILSMVDGVLIAFFLAMISGPLITAYALKLGGGQNVIGLLTGLPWIMQIFSPIAAPLAHYLKSRKKLAVISAFAGRGLWLLALIIPNIVPESLKLPALVTLVGLASLFLAVNNAIWSVLMADVIPCKICARYMGWRNGIMAIVGTLGIILSSIYVDRSAGSLNSILIAIACSVFGGLLGAVALAFHKETRNPIEQTNLKQSYQTPFENKAFKSLIFYGFLVYFSISLMSPLISTYFLNDLRMNFTNSSSYFAFVSLFIFAFGARNGDYIGKVGGKPMLYLSTIGLGILMPLFFILAKSESTSIVYVAAVFDALVYSIVGPATYILSVKTAPSENRLPYLIMFVAATGLGGGLGGFLSGPMFNFLNQFQFLFLGIDWNGHRLMFLFISILRISTIKALAFVKEENAWSVKNTVKYILTTVFRRGKSDLNE